MLLMHIDSTTVTENVHCSELSTPAATQAFSRFRNFIRYDMHIYRALKRRQLNLLHCRGVYREESGRSLRQNLSQGGIPPEGERHIGNV